MPGVLIVEIGPELGEYKDYVQGSSAAAQYLPPVMTILSNIIEIVRWPEYSDMALSNYIQDLVGISSDITNEVLLDDMKLYIDTLEDATQFIIGTILAKLRENGCFNYGKFPYQLYHYNDTCLILTKVETD